MDETYAMVMIGVLLERHGAIMNREDPQTLEDLEATIFNTFGFYVYRGQSAIDILQNIRNQI